MLGAFYYAQHKEVSPGTDTGTRRETASAPPPGRGTGAELSMLANLSELCRRFLDMVAGLLAREQGQDRSLSYFEV